MAFTVEFPCLDRKNNSITPIDDRSSRRRYLQKQQRLLGILRNTYPPDVVPLPENHITVVVPNTAQGAPKFAKKPKGFQTRSESADVERVIRNKIMSLQKIRDDNRKNFMLRSSTAPTLRATIPLQNAEKQYNVTNPCENKAKCGRTDGPGTRPSSRLYPRSLTAPVSRLQRIQTNFLNKANEYENVSLSPNVDRNSAITYAAVIAAIKDSKKAKEVDKKNNTCLKAVQNNSKKVTGSSGIHGIIGFSGGYVRRSISQNSGTVAGVVGVMSIQSTQNKCSNSMPVLSRNNNINSRTQSAPQRHGQSAYSRLFGNKVENATSTKGGTCIAKLTEKHLERNMPLFVAANHKLDELKNVPNSVNDFLQCSSARTHRKYSASSTITPIKPKDWPDFIPPKRSSQSALVKRQVKVSMANDDVFTNNDMRVPRYKSSQCNTKARTVRFSADTEVYEYELNAPLRPGFGSTLDLRATLDLHA